jgi:hypothetical protein
VLSNEPTFGSFELGGTRIGLTWAGLSATKLSHKFEHKQKIDALKVAVTTLESRYLIAVTMPITHMLR